MTTLAATRIRQRTPEWLDVRRDGITATDAAVIAGETGSVIELWAQKRGLVDPPVFDQATQELMDEGLAIQPYLLDYWRRKNPDRRARAINTMRRSRVWPVAMSSPDGEVVGERVGIEAKMTMSPRWPAAMAAGEAVPGDVFAQVQWQMFTAGWSAVDVVVLLFGRPRVVPIARDDAYVENLLWLARQFYEWWQSGTRPPIDGSDNARHVLSRLYPRNDGTMLAPSPDLDAVAVAWHQAKDDLKAAADAEGTLGNTLRALIGAADGFEGAWGRITLKNNRRIDWAALAAELEPAADLVAMHTTTDWKAVAETLRPRPALVARYSSPDGPRVLRPTWKGEPE